MTKLDQTGAFRRKLTATKDPLGDILSALNPIRCRGDYLLPDGSKISFDTLVQTRCAEFARRFVENHIEDICEELVFEFDADAIRWIQPADAQEVDHE